MLAKDFDPERGDVSKDQYSKVKLLKPRGKQWKGKSLQILSRGFKISTGRGKSRRDGHDHVGVMACTEQS